MASEELDGRSGHELVALALAEGELGSDAYWDVVRHLQGRGDEATLDLALSLCAESSARSRILGLEVVSQLGYQQGRPFLEQSLPTVLRLCVSTDEPAVVEAAVDALGHLGDPRGFDAVHGQAGHASDDVRLSVAMALPFVTAGPGHSEARTVEALSQLTGDGDPEVRDWATFALGVLVDVDTPEVRSVLRARVDDPVGDTAGEAIVGLALRRDSEVAPVDRPAA